MNENRMRQAMEGVTSVAQRVLEAVPIQEPWAKAQIVAELKRAGSSISVDVMHGCLNNLRGKGLISEPEPGKFIRIQARKKQPAAEQPQDVKEPMASPKPEATVSKPDDASALDRLAAVAALLHGAAAELKRTGESLSTTGEALSAIATGTEEIALDVAQEIQRNGADSEKLRQLQALLKGLGN